MAKGFTDIAIRNLKAGDVRREIPDPGAQGLYVIVQPSGKKSFAVRYRYNGKPRKLTLAGGLTLKAARKLASDALYDVEQGRDPAQAKKETRAKTKAAKANTVRALCENYLSREAGKLRTGQQRKRALERLVYPEIGDVPLADLKRSHIVGLLDKIEDENGAKMADLTLAYVRKIFNWHASRVDDFVSPVVRSMSRYNAAANRGTRKLSDDELRKLWVATEPNEEEPQPFHALVRFLLLTGARRAEAQKMTRAEIDGSDWTLPAARNKVNVDLVRPLSKAAQRTLESVPIVNSGALVFSHDGRHPIALTLPRKRLEAATGVTGWRLHDLRRTSRTLLSKAGIPPDHAEQCLGHLLPAMRATYDKHDFYDEKKLAFEKLATLIEHIVHPPSDVVTPLRRRARSAS
jgi:integrase